MNNFKPTNLATQLKHKFLERDKLPKVMEEKIETLNELLSSKGID